MRRAYLLWLGGVTLAACHAVSGLAELEIVEDDGAGGGSSGGGQGAAGAGMQVGGFGGVGPATSTSTNVGGGDPCSITNLAATADGDITEGLQPAGGAFAEAFVGMSNGDEFRAAMRFPRPPDGLITEASLCVTGTVIGNPININVHAIGAAWDESALDWYTSWNTPGGDISGPIANGTGPTTGPSEVCIDLKDFFGNGQPDVFFGFMLVPAGAGSNDTFMIQTREGPPPAPTLRVRVCP